VHDQAVVKAAPYLLCCRRIATKRALVGCTAAGGAFDWHSAVPQVSLAKPVIALIGKNYHERQVNMRPNVVQVRLLTHPPSPCHRCAMSRGRTNLSLQEKSHLYLVEARQPYPNPAPNPDQTPTLSLALLHVVQALLEGIALCQPQPKLPSELIKYLGKSFCAWHTAIPLLESHVMIFPQVLHPPWPPWGLNM